ncbi:hypothetical protein BC940DRAFT_321494 [Gongronella butleri]|nr:hypothetical protein BC940DRAFT_321494 [Gongronella butleri]
MDTSRMQLLQRAIHCTRLGVLALSVTIILASLSQYSKHAVPILALLKNEERVSMAVIQDRRLIATLVASQASIFCPLFLLMSQCCGVKERELAGDQDNNDTDSTFQLTNSPSAKAAIAFMRSAFDLFCQFLMPLGLVLSWLFCISFDHKTALLLDEPVAPISFMSYLTLWQGYSTAIVTIQGLKCTVVLALLVEMILVTMAWVVYCCQALMPSSLTNKQHTLQLPVQEPCMKA